MKSRTSVTAYDTRNTARQPLQATDIVADFCNIYVKVIDWYEAVFKAGGFRPKRR